VLPAWGTEPPPPHADRWQVRAALPTAAAIDAPHGVKQKNQKSPERNKFETPFGELIVSGSGLLAARTNRVGALARTHGDFNGLVIGTEAGLLVNKSREAVAPI
jgi:hypothetical protein